MEKTGRKILATTIEKIFPKLEEAVILIYLETLENAFRPSMMPSSKHIQIFLQQYDICAFFDSRGAVSTEIPTSDSTTAGKSFCRLPKTDGMSV